MVMLRALIVDDDPVSKRFLAEILAPYAACDLAAQRTPTASTACGQALDQRRPTTS